MASKAKRRAENVAGDLYVDSTCIDCDTCRWMAPATFDRAGEQSFVQRQPATADELQRALMALVACPTSSIGTVAKHDMEPVLAAFPDRIEGPVYHCGYHHENSFGATSYFIQRERGNVLVDSPRFAGPLVKRLEQLGGVDTLFLTHKDDVADHARFHAHFGCKRVIHAGDAEGELADLELVIEGEEPVALDDDLLVIPTPGHTRGSACLLFDERYLFTGDHLAWSESRSHLYAFRSACWYDWRVQTASMQGLAQHAFEWVLPGHGWRRHIARTEMPAAMTRAIAWMQAR